MVLSALMYLQAACSLQTQLDGLRRLKQANQTKLVVLLPADPTKRKYADATALLSLQPAGPASWLCALGTIYDAPLKQYRT